MLKAKSFSVSKYVFNFYVCVIELLRHGRTGAGSRAVEALGLHSLQPTQTVLRDLFEWADVIPIPTSREAVA